MQDQYYTQSIESDMVSRLAFCRPTSSYLLGYLDSMHHKEDYKASNSINNLNEKCECYQTNVPTASCDDITQKDSSHKERTMKISLPF